MPEMSQATSERVEELIKATRMLSACFEYSVCTYEFYFSLGQGAHFRDRCRGRDSCQDPVEGIQSIAGHV